MPLLGSARTKPPSLGVIRKRPARAGVVRPRPLAPHRHTSATGVGQSRLRYQTLARVTAVDRIAGHIGPRSNAISRLMAGG